MFVDQSSRQISQFSCEMKSDIIELSLKVGSKLFTGVIVEQQLSSFNQIQPFSIKQLYWLLSRRRTAMLTFHPTPHLALCLARLKSSKDGIYIHVKLRNKDELQNQNERTQPVFDSVSIIRKLVDLQHQMQELIKKAHAFQEKFEEILNLKTGIENMAIKLEQLGVQQKDAKQRAQFTYYYCLDHISKAQNIIASLQRKKLKQQKYIQKHSRPQSQMDAQMSMRKEQQGIIQAEESQSEMSETMI